MRVCLIQPNEFEQLQLEVCGHPLALESLAAHLNGHEVQIVDLRVDDRPLEVLLQEQDPDVVGVTCTFTSGVRIAQRLLQTIRQAAPRAKVVMGGVHASLQPGDFAYPLSDYVVRGTGERSFAMLVEALATNQPVSQVPGLLIQKPGGHTSTVDRPAEWRWSRDYRLPARHLTAQYRDRYSRSRDGEPMVIMVSSRGCPHRCTFCAAWKLQDGKLDTRDPDSLIQEITRVEEDFIYFFDDNTLANRRVMGELADRLLSERVHKKYQMWTSSDTICRNPKLMEKWREAGLVRIFCGFESASDDRQDAIGKRNRIALSDRALAVCRDLGIELSATFIVDMRFSEADFDQLDDFVHQRGIQQPWYSILTPLPGTELFTQMAPQIQEAHPGRYDLMHLVVMPDKMSPETFMQRFVDLYQKNESWQGARHIALYEKFLKNVASVLNDPILVHPVDGLPPHMTAFPQPLQAE